MGLFDSVYEGCPTCGQPIEFQSKEGECYMHSYTLESAPTEVLRDVLNDPQYCRHCGNWAALYDPQFPPNIIVEPPRPAPKMVKLRQPTNPDIHSSQPELRWWNEPFSEADFAKDEL